MERFIKLRKSCFTHFKTILQDIKYFKSFELQGFQNYFNILLRIIHLVASIIHILSVNATILEPKIVQLESET